MSEHTTVFITSTTPGVGTRTYTESGKKTSMDVNSLTANTDYIANAEYEDPNGVVIRTSQGYTFRTLAAGTFSISNEQWINNNDGQGSTLTFTYSSTYAISSIQVQVGGSGGSIYQCTISGNTATASLPYFAPGTQRTMEFTLIDIYTEQDVIGRILTLQASTMETPFWVKVNSLYPSNVTYVSFYKNGSQVQFEYSTDMINWTSATSVTVSSSSKTYIRSDSVRSTSMGMMYNRNVPVDVGGNIMSLLTPNSATWIDPQSLSDSAFLMTFYGDQSNNSYCRIMDAHELILPDLKTFPDKCFDKLFAGNTELKVAPVLPKPEKIGARCFAEMFRKTGITTIDGELTARNLGDYAYYEMFHSCSSLRNTPKIYHFKSSPYCCMEMFYHCNNLSEITCLARDISATDCMKNWVSGVAASGTFIKSSNMSSWPRGTSGIPSGWTVRNYSN